MLRISAEDLWQCIQLEDEILPPISLGSERVEGGSISSIDSVIPELLRKLTDRSGN
jgi:hypothetical protein